MQTVAWNLGLTARRLSSVSSNLSSALHGVKGWKRPADAQIPFARDAETEELIQQVTLEIADESAEEAEAALVTRAGHERARATDWEQLAEDVLQADGRRATTPGGVRHRTLLQSGALLLMDTPIRQGDPVGARAALAAFQEANTAAPHCPVRAALAARANVGLAWATRGDGPAAEVTAEQWRSVDARIARARQILAPFDGQDSAILGEARYRTAVLGDAVQKTLPPLFEAWAAADPQDPAPMEMHGFYLLPRWGGDHGEVELQARRAALRTEDDLGYAGYAMLSLPLLEHEPEVLLSLDPALFVEGVDDWLDVYPEPGRVNGFLRELVDLVSASYPTLDGRPEVASFKQHLAEALPDLVRRHLRSVVPAAWNDDVDWVRGIVAHAYRDHLRNKGTVSLTEKGAKLG